MAQRASVASARRAWLLARAVATPWPLARGRHAPALPANDALVRCAAEPARSEGAASFVVDLFTRLERRDRLQQPLGAREGLR